MSESIAHVTQKTVNGRQIIAVTKEYGGETHEVYIPTEQGLQIMYNLLSLINDQKDSQKDEFVLVRKSELGYIHE